MLSPAKTAFFLDVDGTLAEIVSDPRQARVSPEVLSVLDALDAAADGAVALISGRSIAQLDQMLAPLRLPCVGVHGLEQRGPDGRITRAAVDDMALARLTTATGRFAEATPGLLAEVKPGSVALHFRNRPQMASACLHFMEKQAARNPDFFLITGKMVTELKCGPQNKGDAIAGLMTGKPFAGRRAFFAGDDVTDEAGFSKVNAMDGVSVKVGAGQTCAQFRLADPAAVARYLAGLTDFRPGSAEQSMP